MHWAEYRTDSEKAKLYLGVYLNNGIPRKLFLTEGNGAKDPLSVVSLRLAKQVCWTEDIKHIICLINGSSMDVIFSCSTAIGLRNFHLSEIIEYQEHAILA